MVAILLALSFSPALVDVSTAPPVTREIETEGAHPFLDHFKKGRSHLYFVSAHHDNDPAGETFKLIEKAFTRFPIERVILEGREQQEGEFRARRLAGPPYQSELDYANELGHRRGASVIGGEPPERAHRKLTLAAGYSDEDWLGAWFVTWIPIYRRRGELSAEAVPRLFDELMFWKRAAGVPRRVKFEYEDFLRWYAAKAGRPFEERELGLTPPLAQEIFRAASLERNRFILNAIAGDLARYDHVLVVFGNGHLAAQRRAIEESMGRPVETIR